MELIRLREKFNLSSQRRRKWLILLAISGVSTYGVYKVYHLPSITRKRKRLYKIIQTFISITELIADSAETVNLITKDLNTFLNSNSDQIPNSLKQISKLTNSTEFNQSLSRISQSVTIGIFRGYNSESKTSVGTESNVVDRVIDKVFSKSGTGFVSVVIGSFAKNLVLGFYSNDLKKVSDDDTSQRPQWLDLLCDEKCREVLSDCIQKFTSTAVAVYLDKTMEINTYDQIFAGLTNPNHQESIKDVLVSVCNGALETLVKTSHEVFTAKSNGLSVGEEGNGFNFGETISTTLAIPSNRKFMFDVTGRVTLETTRSIIAFVMLKTFQGFRNGLSAVQGEVTGRGRQVVGYVGAKSSVIMTVCLALYLHIISRCVRNSPIGVNQHF